jgi:hypothetical protein
MKKLLIGLALVALAVPAGALAGGWATAGVGPPDDGIGAGDTWNAKVTILQHGNPETPLMGVTPTLTIRKGSISKTFRGTETDLAGVSTIKVVFPSAGKWSYAVYDGFTEYGGATTHKFAPVQIGAAGSNGGGFPTLTVTTVLLALLGIAVVLYLLARRVRVRAPAPTH